MTLLVTQKLQSSDSDDLEDHRKSHCLEMDSFVEHSYEVLFVLEGDV